MQWTFHLKLNWNNAYCYNFCVKKNLKVLLYVASGPLEAVLYTITYSICKRFKALKWNEHVRKYIWKGPKTIWIKLCIAFMIEQRAENWEKVKKWKWNKKSFISIKIHSLRLQFFLVRVCVIPQNYISYFFFVCTKLNYVCDLCAHFFLRLHMCW